MTHFETRTIAGIFQHYVVTIAGEESRFWKRVDALDFFEANK